MSQDKLTKKDKLDALSFTETTMMKDIDEKYIDMMYNKIKKKVIEKKNNNRNIDKTTPRYKLLLKFMNMILTNIKKPNIQELTDFKDIDRLDIIKPENQKSFDSIQDEILKTFDKKAIRWQTKKYVKRYIMSFIRFGSSDIGLEFINYKKHIQKNSISRTHYIYSII